MTAPRFHLLAGLLLLGGASLGFFGGHLLAGAPAAAHGRADRRIEAQVEHYRTTYGLDAGATERVRDALASLRLAIQQKRIDLQARHQAEFDALVAETGRRIQDIVDAAGPLDTPISPTPVADKP